TNRALLTGRAGEAYSSENSARPSGSASRLRLMWPWYCAASRCRWTSGTGDADQGGDQRNHGRDALIRRSKLLATASTSYRRRPSIGGVTSMFLFDRPDETVRVPQAWREAAEKAA